MTYSYRSIATHTVAIDAIIAGQLSPDQSLEFILGYVHQMAGNAKPYAGVFYRRVFISQYKDLSNVGLRAGLMFISTVTGPFYWSCPDTDPELRLAIVF